MKILRSAKRIARNPVAWSVLGMLAGAIAGPKVARTVAKVGEAAVVVLRPKE